MSQRKEREETQAKPIPLDKKRKAPGVAAATANKHLTLVKAAFSRYRKDKGLDVPGLADGLLRWNDVAAIRSGKSHFSSRPTSAYIFIPPSCSALQCKLAGASRRVYNGRR